MRWQAIRYKSARCPPTMSKKGPLELGFSPGLTPYFEARKIESMNSRSRVCSLYENHAVMDASKPLCQLRQLEKKWH